MNRTLYVLPYSPWSERARWALLHHELSFVEREHTPLLGELALRRRAGRWRGLVSVPLLVHDEGSIVDSEAIGEYADAHGSRGKLFPEGRRAAIREIVETAEGVLNAARARTINAALSDEEVARDLLPPPLRSAPFATATARLGARFVGAKYKATYADIENRIRDGLRAVRQALAGRATIFESFSFADIAAATGLQAIKPVSSTYVPISTVKERSWTDAALAEEFADLVAWRDRLYEQYRPLPSA